MGKQVFGKQCHLHLNDGNKSTDKPYGFDQRLFYFKNTAGMRPAAEEQFSSSLFLGIFLSKKSASLIFPYFPSQTYTLNLACKFF